MAASPPSVDFPEASPAQEGVSLPSRRERKKERTRREIYRAAMKLFARRGFDAVTIESICDAADVARGTFFLHFPTKSALLFEYQRLMVSAFRERLSGPRVSAAHEFRALVELLSEYWSENADVMQAMLREALSSTETLEAGRREGHHLHDLLQEIVQHGQAVGEFRDDIDPRLAAVTYLSTMCAFLSGLVLEPDEQPPAELRDQLMALILGGLTSEAQPRRRPRARRT